MIKPFSVFYKIITCLILIAILAISLPLSSFAERTDGKEPRSVSEIEGNAFDVISLSEPNADSAQTIESFCDYGKLLDLLRLPASGVQIDYLLTSQYAGLVQCFVAGTLVASKSGLVPIESIQPGDLVWASDPDTGETELKRVVRTFKNESEELVHLTVNGEEIVTTPGHPFWVPVKGWTKAIHLRAGDRLQLLNGQYVVVEQVQHELLESPVFVYNFEVEDFHTYYVGSYSVLVHNKCSNQTVSSTKRPQAVAIGKITGYTDHGLKAAMYHDKHGIHPSTILDVVKNPSKVVEQIERGTIKYVNEKGVVVLNKAG